jgi:hypothetical protein
MSSPYRHWRQAFIRPRSADESAKFPSHGSLPVSIQLSQLYTSDLVRADFRSLAWEGERGNSRRATFSLSDADRAELKRISRSRTEAKQRMERAKRSFWAASMGRRRSCWRSDLERDHHTQVAWPIRQTWHDGSLVCSESMLGCMPFYNVLATVIATS